MLTPEQRIEVFTGVMQSESEAIALTKQELLEQVELADTLLESALQTLQTTLSSDLSVQQKNRILYAVAAKRMEGFF